MWKYRWLLALPLAFVVMVGTAAASSIRDEASLFTPDVVREAEAKLNEVERKTGVTTTIETIDSLQGQSINKVAVERARATGGEGLFILIPKREHRLWVLASRHYTRALNAARRQAIEESFVSAFKKHDFDAGLKDGAETIEREITTAQAENGGHLRQAEAPPAGPIRGQPLGRPAGRNSFGLGSLVVIGLLIVAVLVVIRIIGSLSAAASADGPGAGPPGMGPGFGGGPGYGAGGYGGRGGGFFSSLLGGIGGAMAGNWLYDQFSGHHQGGTHTADSTAYVPDSDAAPTSGGDEWSGGAGTGGDWGGGDAGGDGGGGDWGGGGGGDWGGGGGGDWGGGGGGDGGSW